MLMRPLKLQRRSSDLDVGLNKFPISPLYDRECVESLILCFCCGKGNNLCFGMCHVSCSICDVLLNIQLGKQRRAS